MSIFRFMIRTKPQVFISVNLVAVVWLYEKRCKKECTLPCCKNHELFCHNFINFISIALSKRRISFRLNSSLTVRLLAASHDAARQCDLLATAIRMIALWFRCHNHNVSSLVITLLSKSAFAHQCGYIPVSFSNIYNNYLYCCNNVTCCWCAGEAIVN